MSKSQFTIYFEDPFWVGVYEREEEGSLRTAKIIFGPEPRDGEVYEFLLQNWHRLVFGPAVPADTRSTPNHNPKRTQRAIAKQLNQPGVGTKAQQAMKLAQEEGKQARKTRNRRQKLEEEERRFALRTQKRKEKHRGH